MRRRRLDARSRTTEHHAESTANIDVEEPRASGYATVAFDYEEDLADVTAVEVKCDRVNRPEPSSVRADHVSDERHSPASSKRRPRLLAEVLCNPKSSGQNAQSTDRPDSAILGAMARVSTATHSPRSGLVGLLSPHGGASPTFGGSTRAQANARRAAGPHSIASSPSPTHTGAARRTEHVAEHAWWGAPLLPSPLLLGLLMLLGSTPAHAQADQRFKEGQELFAHGKYSEAHVKFVEACAAHRTNQCPKNLALAEVRLEMHADAATHLREYLGTKDGASDKQSAELRQLLTAEQTKVGELKISARDGAVIKVGDRIEGKAPLTGTVFVEPGTHKVTATYGTEVEERTVTVAARGMVDVDANGKVTPIPSASTAPSATVTAPPTSSAPPPPPPSQTPKIVAGATVAGVGLVGLVLGGVFAGVSNGAKSDQEALAAGGACRTLNSASCDDWRSKADQQNTFHTVSLISLISGAAIAAGGIAILVWGATSSTTVSAAPNNGGMSVVLRGAF